MRTLEGTNRAGINRIHWDLRDETSTRVRLHTPPMYAEGWWVVEPEGRSAPGASRLSILMPPGDYTVKLEVDGTEQAQPLTVLKDPNTGGSESEIAEQVGFSNQFHFSREFKLKNAVAPSVYRRQHRAGLP